MKWFWLAVLALVVGTGALVLWPSRAPEPELAELASPSALSSNTPEKPALAPMLVPSPQITVLPEEAPVTPIDAIETPATMEVAGLPAPTDPLAETQPADPLKQLDELLGLAVESERAESTPIEQALAGSPATTPPAAPADAEPELIASEKFKEIVKARVRKTEDGWTLYDERFPVRGSGTADDPYEVSWDHLVSASETYQPRQGKLRLPERITMLDGKQVRITGYVAFPIMAASNDEMLSMRNMWDGCCIGIPPTPYDAIEVRLAEAATGRDRFTSFGTIEGKFVVDPYVKGNWLLGLYLMENASLSKVRENQTDPSRHGM